MVSALRIIPVIYNRFSVDFTIKLKVYSSPSTGIWPRGERTGLLIILALDIGYFLPSPPCFETFQAAFLWECTASGQSGGKHRDKAWHWGTFKWSSAPKPLGLIGSTLSGDATLNDIHSFIWAGSRDDAETGAFLASAFIKNPSEATTSASLTSNG